MPETTDLPSWIRLLRAGESGERRAEQAFRAATLWFQRPERPGFLAVAGAQGPLIAVFSSLEQLVRYAGVCDWASTTGEDLLGLLPTGHRLLLDPVGPDPQLIDPTAWSRPNEDGTAPEEDGRG